MFRRAYEPVEEIKNGEVEAGDLIVMSQGTIAGPGHAAMIGPRTGSVWHSTGREVETVGLISLFQPRVRLYGVYRMKDKDRWLAS